MSPSPALAAGQVLSPPSQGRCRAPFVDIGDTRTGQLDSAPSGCHVGGPQELAARIHFAGTPAIREDIARTIPMYAGIEHLASEGDQFQYGGPHLCWGWQFPTPDGMAHFSPALPPPVEVPEGMLLAATRRGKQFNSMVQGATDDLTGAVRDAVLISGEDAARLGLASGDPVRVTNQRGQLRGTALLARVQPGTLQLHWPEAEVLIDPTKRAAAGVPDYNALVRVEPLTPGSPDT